MAWPVYYYELLRNEGVQRKNKNFNAKNPEETRGGAHLKHRTSEKMGGSASIHTRVAKRIDSFSQKSSGPRFLAVPVEAVDEHEFLKKMMICLGSWKLYNDQQIMQRGAFGYVSLISRFNAELQMRGSVGLTKIFSNNANDRLVYDFAKGLVKFIFALPSAAKSNGHRARKMFLKLRALGRMYANLGFFKDTLHEAMEILLSSVLHCMENFLITEAVQAWTYVIRFTASAMALELFHFKEEPQSQLRVYTGNETPNPMKATFNDDMMDDMFGSGFDDIDVSCDDSDSECCSEWD